MGFISPHVSFQWFHVVAMYLSNLMENNAYWTSALAEGSYNFSPVRSSVRPFVTAISQKLFITFF